MPLRTTISFLLLTMILGCDASSHPAGFLPQSARKTWLRSGSDLAQTATDRYHASYQVLGDEQGRPHLVVLEVKASDMKPCLNMPVVMDGGFIVKGEREEPPAWLVVIYNNRAGELKQVPLSDEAARLFARSSMPAGSEVVQFWESLKP
jgi:hypothetical protein